LWAQLAGLTALAEAQSNRPDQWARRTSWGDPDLQGEWTSEGEFGVPFERPAEFGARELLTDEEYAKRMADVQQRDARDLKARPDAAGVFEYACHEGNYGMRNMLSTARYLEGTAR
jgi:hypothetical protein